MFSSQVMGQGNGPEDVLEEDLRLGQLARSHRPAGQPAAGGGDYLPAVAAEGVQVVLGDGILEHLGVHGRGDELGTGAGQHSGGEHVVGQAVGQFGAHVGGGRGDDDQICPVSQGDVLHLVGEVPVEGVHHAPVSCELLKGEGGDKLGGVGGHNNLHGGVLLHQRRGQCRRLIGGDAPGHAQQNGFAF